MSTEEFKRQYQERSGLTDDEMNDFMANNIVMPCKCEQEGCSGWAMVSNSELSINAHLNLYL